MFIVAGGTPRPPPLNNSPVPYTEKVLSLVGSLAALSSQRLKPSLASPPP